MVHNPVGTVNLFQQNYTHQLVGKCHARKTELNISPV